MDIFKHYLFEVIPLIMYTKMESFEPLVKGLPVFFFGDIVEALINPRSYLHIVIKMSPGQWLFEDIKEKNCKERGQDYMVDVLTRLAP